MAEYIFTAYDGQFPAIFEQEKSELRKVLPFATTIEHFGSTAVPGLGGKGVLDIYVLVPADMFELARQKLLDSNIGYDFYNVKELDGGRKMIFRKQYQYAGKVRKTNLHVGTVGIKDFDTCIAFRDALRNSETLCRMYEDVKRLAIEQTENEGEDSKENSRRYVEAKDTFMTHYTQHVSRDR